MGSRATVLQKVKKEGTADKSGAVIPLGSLNSNLVSQKIVLPWHLSPPLPPPAKVEYLPSIPFSY